MFRMLKLKPPHGWNAVAWELVIVFVGVLMALGAQQIVDGIQKRNDRAQLVAALRAELADDRERWELIRTSDPCARKRLDAIERWLAGAKPGARLKDGYRLILWNMHSSAWDLAKTSPATQNIPLDERLTYAALYGAIENWRLFFDEENKNSQALNSLLGAGDASANAGEVRALTVRARQYVERREANYRYLFERFDRLGIPPDESQLSGTADPRKLCAPVSEANRQER